MSAAIQMANWQAGFMKILPAVQTHAKIQFRRLPAERREDAIQEAIASACVSVHILAAKGRLHLARPSTIANYAVNHVRSGRHVGGHQDAARDAISPVACRRHGIQIFSLPSEHGLRNHFIADRRTDIPELAAFRIDFGDWLSTFSRRDRRIIALGNGAGNSAVARSFGISEGRVSQLRRQYGVRCVNGIFFLSRGPGMLARDEQITASWPGGVESDH
jgi:hypothetical protein